MALVKIDITELKTDVIELLQTLVRGLARALVLYI